VDDLTKSAFSDRPDLHIGTEGEFKGWLTERRLFTFAGTIKRVKPRTPVKR
jgi:hypothetical protein